MTKNLLSDETSPYLRQHKDNPVHWQPWRPETLAHAKAVNKPILLSVGYAACHWCHVMAHESFEDEQTAALMNDLFINIKVDREERPDVDMIYQAALNMLGEQGGWPLTIFLTPDGNPFWGGTYFPPSARYGRPGFPDVLRGIADVYNKDPNRVTQNVEALRQGLTQLSHTEPGGIVSLETINKIALRLIEETDTVHGGIGQAPKFPQAGIYELIWRYWKRGKDPAAFQAVITTLNNICQGGIYDHLGGGFSRYSVDERWLAPHFEKMLYDNAQLVELLTLVWQETKTPLYADRITETIEWVLRDMTVPGGGFVSAYDADSVGVEGKFYVWDETEIDALLGDGAPLFKKFYDVSANGNWENKNILNRLHTQNYADMKTEAKLLNMRETLFQHRKVRIPPGRDDKVLADWNGLMIAALVRAGTAFQRPDWIEAAKQAFAFVQQNFANNGRLWHSWCDGQSNHPATIDDYAALSRAALFLFEATNDRQYLDQAISWLQTADIHYWDKADGGYFFAADDTADLITRTKSVNDNATPSGNGILAQVYARLFYLTGEPTHQKRTEGIITACSGALNKNFFPLATLLNANEFLLKGLQIVIVGNDDDPLKTEFASAVNGQSLPNLILTVLPPDQHLPDGHPAFGKSTVDDRAAAYICEGAVCSLPITNAETLVQELKKR